MEVSLRASDRRRLAGRAAGRQESIQMQYGCQQGDLVQRRTLSFRVTATASS